MIRIAICQALLPHYRLPLFDGLAAQPDVEVTVFAGGNLAGFSETQSGKYFKLVYAPVKEFKLGPLLFKFQAAQFTAILDRRFDLVILSWDAHYLSLLPCLLLARLRKKPPIVLWGHGCSKWETRSRELLRNLHGRLANCVLLYNRRVAQHLIENRGFSADRVFVAQNALDQSPIREARDKCLANPEALVEFQNLHRLNTRRTLAYVSRLEPDNRIELLINATAILKERYPDLRLLIIGTGSMRVPLEELARKLLPEGSVTFTGAIYQEDKIAPWLLSSTVFVYPVNLGLSLLHAFGYGLPVITSNHIQGHGPEIEALIHESNGLLYRDGDLQSLVERIEYFLKYPDQRDAYSCRALETVLHNYSLDTMQEGFQQVIRRFIPAQQ